MLRNIGAALAGIVIAFALVAAIEQVGHMIYPPPPGLDPSDPEVIRTYLATSPFLAILFPMIAWVVATFAGTVVASKLGTANALMFAAIVGGLVLAATIATLIMIPHPAWFSIVSLLAIAASAWFAAKVAAGPDQRTPAPHD